MGSSGETRLWRKRRPLLLLGKVRVEKIEERESEMVGFWRRVKKSPSLSHGKRLRFLLGICLMTLIVRNWLSFLIRLVIYNRETDQSRGFGFITMSTVEEAEKAVEMFHRYEINGRFLTVNKAAPRGSRPERPSGAIEPSFRIYIGNLPWQVDNARLEQVFSEHGKVVDARVVYDRDTGRSRGFGFVTMSSETEVNDAIAALDGQSLVGRAVRVNVAEDRRRHGSF